MKCSTAAVLVVLCVAASTVLWFADRDPHPVVHARDTTGHTALPTEVNALRQTQLPDNERAARAPPASLSVNMATEETDAVCRRYGWTVSSGGSGTGSRRIVQAILYNGETDLLLVHLYEHYPVVDVFVIVETFYTFRGKRKLFRSRGGDAMHPPAGTPFHLDDAAWRPFRSKLRHLLTDGSPKNAMMDRWYMEETTRALVHKYLVDYIIQPGDIVFTADVDEIVRRSALQALRECEVPTECAAHVKIGLKAYFYDFGRMAAPTQHWYLLAHRILPPMLQYPGDAPVEPLTRVGGGGGRDARLPDGLPRPLLAMPAAEVNTPTLDAPTVATSAPPRLVGSRRIGPPFLGVRTDTIGVTCKMRSAGWHLSWGLPDMKEYLRKLSSFSHAELDQLRFRTAGHIREKVCEGKDLFERREMAEEFRTPPELLNDLPRYLLDHPDEMNYMRPFRCKHTPI